MEPSSHHAHKSPRKRAATCTYVQACRARVHARSEMDYCRGVSGGGDLWAQFSGEPLVFRGLR